MQSDVVRNGADAIAQVRELVSTLTSIEFRVLAIEALRRARKASATQVEFSMHGDLGRALVPLLAEKRGKGVTAAALQLMKEPFLSEQGQPWLQHLVDFTAWLVRTGLATSVYRGTGGYPTAYRITGVGAQLLDRDEDHPLLPGFVERAVARCPALPDEVAVHLADAHSCVEHGLGRPAVVLAGLAYEAAEDAIIDLLGNKVSVKGGAGAAAKIAAVRKAIPALIVDLEERGRADAAWDFADRLRERRNHGSHPRAYPDFSDVSEVHELLLSAGRHLPGLWSVRT